MPSDHIRSQVYIELLHVLCICLLKKNTAFIGKKVFNKYFGRSISVGSLLPLDKLWMWSQKHITITIHVYIHISLFPYMTWTWTWRVGSQSSVKMRGFFFLKLRIEVKSKKKKEEKRRKKKGLDFLFPHNLSSQVYYFLWFKKSGPFARHTREAFYK